MTTVDWVVVLVALQRLAELVHARRNEAQLRAAGAVEHGAGHYPLFVLLHGAWLASVWALADRSVAPSWPLLAAYGVLQPLRLWVILALGRFWTTRVLTLPGAPLVRSGPYRWVRHPNYAIVVGEIALLPLAFGLPAIALAFSLANALLLRHRLRIETAALAERA